MGKELPKEELRYFYKEYLNKIAKILFRRNSRGKDIFIKVSDVENSQNIRSKRGLVSFW
jgi:hypothetical protein